MKNFITIFVLALLAVSLLGCATRTAKNETIFVPPSFHYTPPSSAPVASAGVAFALVDASYSEAQPWTRQYPFTDFSKNMSLDFQQILSARGFTVRGPFASYDEMAFPDKKGSDLVLQPTLEVSINQMNIQPIKHTSIIGQDGYTLRGNTTVSGRVTLVVLESLSKERMWFKSIQLPDTSYEWETETQTTMPGVLDPTDPVTAKTVGKVMEKYYGLVMSTAWKYLDPEEMRIVKTQADDIKKNKVY